MSLWTKDALLPRIRRSGIEQTIMFRPKLTGKTKLRFEKISMPLVIRDQ